MKEKRYSELKQIIQRIDWCKKTYVFLWRQVHRSSFTVVEKQAWLPHLGLPEVLSETEKVLRNKGC